MYEQILEGFRSFPLFSIIVSAAVIFIVFLCVFIIFSFARQERIVEDHRWETVSGHMQLKDAESGELYLLEADEILIGRHSSADIRLPGETVSRYHAVLYVSNSVWRVMDLDSKSGTYLNGKRIQKQAILHPEDEISFGKYKVRFVKKPKAKQGGNG